MSTTFRSLIHLISKYVCMCIFEGEKSQRNVWKIAAQLGVPLALALAKSCGKEEDYVGGNCIWLYQSCAHPIFVVAVPQFLTYL